MKEEEDEWFPEVRRAMGRKALQELGAKMEATKQTRQPTRSRCQAPRAELESLHR